MGKLARNHSGKKGEVIQSTKNNSTQPPNSFAPPDHFMYKYTVNKIMRFLPHPHYWKVTMGHY